MTQIKPIAYHTLTILQHKKLHHKNKKPTHWWKLTPNDTEIPNNNIALIVNYNIPTGKKPPTWINPTWIKKLNQKQTTQLWHNNHTYHITRHTQNNNGNIIIITTKASTKPLTTP